MCENGCGVRDAIINVYCGQVTTVSSVRGGAPWCVPTCAATDSSVSASVIRVALAPHATCLVLISRGVPIAAINVAVTPEPRLAAIPRCDHVMLRSLGWGYISETF